MTKNVPYCLLAVGVLAGCGTGGASTPSAPIATATPSRPAANVARAALQLVIPRGTAAGAARTRAFVSPSTLGVSVEVTHATNGATDYDVTSNFNVSPGSAICTGSAPQTCTLPIPAPVAEAPDFDTFTFVSYDQAPGGSGNAFGTTAKTLGSGTATASITANTNNIVTAYIDGRPASIAFANPDTTQELFVSGDGYLGFASTINVQARDADLNTITGGAYDPYAPAFALSVTEPQPPATSTTLALVPASTAGFSPAPPTCNAPASGVPSVTTCRSDDAITANYLQPAGAAFDTSYYATVSSDTSSVTASQPVYVSPIFVLHSTPANPTAATFTQGGSGTSPLLALDGASDAVMPREFGAIVQGTTPVFADHENAACEGVIASISGPDGAGTFTITGVPLASAADSGGCIVTFGDGFNGSVQLAVTDGGVPPAATARRTAKGR